jgi:ubiquitin C-terminal hydrolase
MSEDAYEYIMALKMYLLEELRPEQVNSDLTASGQPYNRKLHTSMQTFWDLFSSGKTTQTVTCSEFSNVTSRDDDFSEIMLKFLQQPSAGGRQQYTLASLYQHYSTGVIDDFMCNFCNSSTSATRQEHISKCPEVLTVVLLHNANNEDENIDNAVHFPLERVCPSTLGEQQEEIADHTLYKLFGTVQPQTNENSRGHYKAITNKGTGNLWHVYNNSDVKICKFQNRKQNKTLLGFQKSVSILF